MSSSGNGLSTNADLIRWHARLRKRGYQAGLHPAEILQLALASARRESTVLRAMLASLRATMLPELSENPDLLAHELASHGARHPLSLLHPELVLGLETAVLAFASALVARPSPPSWLLRDTYLGRKIRGLVLELRDPKPAGLAWKIHEAATPELVATRDELDAAIDADRWPDPTSCAVVLAVLEAIERRIDLSPAQRATLVLDKWIFRHLQAGVAGVFIIFMLSTLDRAEHWCRARTPCRGPMQQLAHDLAAPILRMAGLDVPSRPRFNRRPLHVARRNVITGDDWSRRQRNHSLTANVEGMLWELGAFTQERCHNDNAAFSSRSIVGVLEDGIS